MNIEKYLISNLPILQFKANRIISRFEAWELTAADELINEVYLQMISKKYVFNSTEHFNGTYYLKMKWLTLDIIRSQVKFARVDVGLLRGFDSDLENTPTNMATDSLIKKCLAEEENGVFVQVINELADGSNYKDIAEKLNIDKRNVRHVVFRAKASLRRRLEKYGVCVKNEIYHPSWRSLRLEAADATLYDDWPIGVSCNKTLIGFCLRKNRHLSSTQIKCMIAKNRGMTITNTHSAISTALRKMVDEGLVMESRGNYSLVY